MSKESMTPRQIVSELDKYIVGQKDAKNRSLSHFGTVIAGVC